MAVIQKIRNKYAKVAGFIIALALVGFILMDAASGSFGDLFGHDNSVVKVNGDKVDVKDYSTRVKDYEILYNYSTKGRPIDDQTRAQLNEEALRDLISEKLVTSLAEKLGLQTTKEEAKELVYGANPDPAIQQYPMFTNPDTKMFDPQRVKLFEQQIDQQDPTGKYREEWETIKAYVLRTNLQRKYNAMLVRNLYEPKFISDFKAKEQSEYASINYVRVPYASIPDDQIKVTDEDLIDYMKKHKALFDTKDETRSIEYVSFEVLPTSEDTARALDAVKNLKTEFANTTDAESMVNRNSEEPFENAYVNKKSFMSYYADSVFQLPVGGVFGPYYEAGAYKLTKMLDKKQLPDSAKCRHILIRTKERGQDIAADSVAKRRIDSVVAAINSGASFDTMVLKVSEDEGSKATNGEYTFTLQQRAGISKEFGDFIFEGKPGEKKVVKVDNNAYAGYHYIEILEQKGVQQSVKVATITKSLFAGDNTENAVYAKATEFAGKNNTAAAFDESVKKEKIDKKIADNIKMSDFTVPGLGGGTREIVRWVYESKEGEVSGVFQLNGRYIVAKLTGVNKPGELKLTANIRPQVEMSVRNQKKKEIIALKYKSAGTLEAIAQSSAQPVQRADSFNLANPYSKSLGYDPKTIGYVFNPGVKQGVLSPAIQSQEGVTYFVITQKYMQQPTQDPGAIMQQKMMAENMLRNNASGMIMDIVRRKASIKYSAKNL